MSEGSAGGVSRSGGRSVERYSLAVAPVAGYGAPKLNAYGDPV